MGRKYEVRYRNDDAFIGYNDEFTNDFLEFIRIIFINRKRLIYFTIRF
jgi:hypothetical protein